MTLGEGQAGAMGQWDFYFACCSFCRSSLLHRFASPRLALRCVALPLSKNVKCAMHNKLDVAVEIKRRSDMGRKHGTAEAKQKQRIRWAGTGDRGRGR